MIIAAQSHSQPTALKRVLGMLALLILIGMAIGRSSVGTQLDSFTVDEPWHVVAGTSYVRSGDFRLNPEHPPLVKLWVGSWMPDSFTLRPPAPLSEKAQERTFVEQTLFVDNDPVAAQLRARIAMWSFHGVLLIALGMLLWRACGLPWALGTLAFLAIEPTVSAHLPVVMTDLPLALTVLLATVASGVLAATWQWRWAVAVGVALGLALGAKHSALAAVGGLALVLLIASQSSAITHGWHERIARLCKLLFAALLAVAVLWAQYGFRFHAGSDGSDAFNRPMAAKIAELNIPVWREGLAFADHWQLLPRAYLWGLADTVRTGVEGRGISEHFVWGIHYTGSAPWFAWPAIVASKVPVALLMLILLGASLLWRSALLPTAKWTLWAALGGSAFHLLALTGSGAIWGGVRHALPLIAAIALLAGAAVSIAWQRRSRLALGLVAALLVAAFALTIREPRLWEYHNELVGGTANGFRYFSNEGLDLGQRFGEIRAFHDREIKGSGLPLYSDYWMGEEQTRAAGLVYQRRVTSLDDNNVAGIYEGWFIYTRSDELAWPSWNWDPADVFKDLQPVARFGHATICKGRQVRPQTRAGSMTHKVIDYIYKEGGNDWPLVAQRLEEVVAQMPQSISPAVELGNAYLRIGDAAQATAAYRRVLDQQQVPVDARVADQLRSQIALIAASDDVRNLPLMRNPWLE